MSFSTGNEKKLAGSGGANEGSSENNEDMQLEIGLEDEINNASVINKISSVFACLYPQYISSLTLYMSQNRKLLQSPFR